MNPSSRAVVGRPFVRIVVVVAALAAFSASAAWTQGPGEFAVETDRTAGFPWTPGQMRSFLPERGRFTFPAPYGTEAIRVTNASDCGGSDCVEPVGGASWRNIDAHSGRDSMFIFLGLRKAGPTLFRYHKKTGRTENLGPLFEAKSPLARRSGEGWYFSARRPATLYLTSGARLLRYDVLARTFETALDATAEFGEDKEIGTAYSSDDDKVHSAALRDSASGALLGCLAYREDLRQFSYHPANGALAGCEIDKSGRWLVIKENADGVAGVDNRIVDLETGAETLVPGQDGAGGHSANGSGYIIAADNGKGRPGGVRVWRFDQDPPQGELVYSSRSADGVAVGAIAHSNARPGVPLSRQYACAPATTTTTPAAASEIVCFRLDGSGEVRALAQAMAPPDTQHVESAPDELPRGNLDVTGRYFLWVGRTGDRRDAFMVKVPEHLAAGQSGKTAADAPASSEPALAETVVAAPAVVLAPDPLGLPMATIAQVPLTVVYNALNVPSRAAGSFYLDPTTGVKIYKLTSATFPTSGSSWGHAYSEGGDEVSLPHTGSTRTIHVYTNSGAHWLIDFTPAVGVSNPRQLTGAFTPWLDLGFTFSNNPATPHFAYISTGGGTTIRRVDFRTMTEVPGNGWPVTGETEAVWLHQSENDGLFTWMRGANGSTVVGYEPSTGTKRTYTNANINEPRIDRAGRYVGISMDSPQNQLLLWDFVTNSIVWTTPDGEIPHAHVASVKGGWLGVNWNISFPAQFTKFTSQPGSVRTIGGPANGHLVHGNGNWIQSPADLRDQWAVFAHYGSLVPNPGWSWLAPGGMILITENGGRRLLGHPYNTTSDYTFYSFAKFSPDGQYVLFTSNMNGSARSDLFLAELPQTGGPPDTTPPTVSLTAPANGATVSGAAVTVSASASDNVGVAGVQFKLDGVNLGAEDTAAPYGVLWNTILSANGSHSLTAVARDAAGNTTTATSIGVTVSNPVDTTPPVLSGIGASGTGSTATTITWTTDEPADTQVEYGTTAAYGSSTPLVPALVTSHPQTLGGLAAATLYHYRVRSRDAAGNLAVSTDFTFTTLAAPGPIAHWKLDEGSGITSADDSGNGHLATLLNGTAWAAGRSGQGLSLDGANDYASVAHAAALDAFPLSVSVWFRTSTTSGVRGLVNKYVGGSYNGYQIFFDTGALCAWFLRDTSNYVYDGTGCSMRTPGYNDGEWHHAVFVVDAAGGRLYVDAIQRASQPWTGTAGPSSTIQELHLGHYPGAFGGAEYLAGLVDDARIYDRALSVAEISQMYEEMPPIDDTVPPVLSGATATGVTGTGATINWNTDEPADSQVDYGTTTAYGSSTALAAPLVTAHNQALSGLVPATPYHYRVRSRDGAGNLAVSGDFTFTTLDTVAPLVALTSPVAGQLLADVVTLSAGASDNVGVVGVQFRLDGVNLGAEDTAAPHDVLWNTILSANGSHSLTAIARDAAGNTTTSTSIGVTVSNPVDTTPPVPSGIGASAIGSTATTITWTTDEPADTQVDYGTTAAYGSSTTLAPALVTAHSQALGGLVAATLYHYRVTSRDAAGNLAVSGDFTFTTLAAPGPVIHWMLDDGSGTNAADSSGNNRNGALTNGPVWTAGRSGLGLRLDGVNDYVRTAHASALNAFPLTVSTWFRTTTTSGTRGLVNKYVSNSYNGYQIFFENGSLCAWYLTSTSNYVYGGGTCPMRTNGYNNGLWHHVAFVVDATGGKLYVDGVQRATQPWTGSPGAPTTTQQVRVGHYPGGTGPKYLPGSVDDVRIYNRALSASEVLQLYNAP